MSINPGSGMACRAAATSGKHFFCQSACAIGPIPQANAPAGDR
jgi:hypothetical protein